MIRYGLLGFVDYDAVKQHSIVLRKPIDMAAVHRLVQEMGETSPNGDISVDGLPFICHEGYLTFPAPVMRRRAVDFIGLAERLAARLQTSNWALFQTRMTFVFTATSCRS